MLPPPLINTRHHATRRLRLRRAAMLCHAIQLLSRRRRFFRRYADIRYMMRVAVPLRHVDACRYAIRYAAAAPCQPLPATADYAIYHTPRR